MGCEPRILIQVTRSVRHDGTMPLPRWFVRIKIARNFKEVHVKSDEYNYASFNMQKEVGKFSKFQELALRTGVLAPDFLVEDLETGQTVHLKDLWRDGLVIIEFGSYT